MCCNFITETLTLRMVNVKIPSYKMRGDMAILECEYELNGNSQRHFNGGGLHRKTTGTPFLSLYNNNNNDKNNDYEDSVEEDTSDSNNNNKNYLRQHEQSNDNNRFFNQQQQKQRQLYQNNNNEKSRTKTKRYSNNYFPNGDYRVAEEDVSSSSSSSIRHHSDSGSSLNSGSYNNNYEYPNKYSVQPKEALYSVKWYRDNEEFYRYVPKDNPPQNSYVVDGIKVDVSNYCCWCCNEYILPYLHTLRNVK